MEWSSPPNEGNTDFTHSSGRSSAFNAAARCAGIDAAAKATASTPPDARANSHDHAPGVCTASTLNTGCGPTSITLPDGKPGVDLSGLTFDEQFEAGITCDGAPATPTSGFASCDNAGYRSTLVQTPAPNTENEDHNPPRIAPHSLFDASIGKDNLLHWSKRYELGAQITAINFTNRYALYNFLSTFSGTHYVTPRAITAEINLHF